MIRVNRSSNDTFDNEFTKYFKESGLVIHNISQGGLNFQEFTVG